LRIICPKPRRKPRSSDHNYNPPFPLIWTGESQELVNYALSVQTFAINCQLTFSIIPFDRTALPWVIANITGGAIHRGNE
jgi:hypothetical protein